MILHRRFPSRFLSDRFGSRIELPMTGISMPNQPSEEPIIFHLTVNWLSRPDAYQAAPSSAKAGRATGRAAVLIGQNADAGRLRQISGSRGGRFRRRRECQSYAAVILLDGHRARVNRPEVPTGDRLAYMKADKVFRGLVNDYRDIIRFTRCRSNERKERLLGFGRRRRGRFHRRALDRAAAQARPLVQRN
jgi:hypothetical protein